ncbi:flagellar hook-length control protein FliK [Entomospira entomophila]|uniref:Flagellar hook-length control protein-like C-terminal domain-containing protein n=1 Tax=Entomospira entomophila TaxID=2719988 RepID=A0A968KT85_9SPIO|nr:flagellar hook-length control protein FliK [Entomospira entomophilus]NIZ40036.1 hypothetical protein [Entomospira entomophilus]WDI35597.1 flagellar hook-length control protein FliK [Entomospira entomophilus]
MSIDMLMAIGAVSEQKSLSISTDNTSPKGETEKSKLNQKIEDTTKVSADLSQDEGQLARAQSFVDGIEKRIEKLSQKRKSQEPALESLLKSRKAMTDGEELAEEETSLAEFSLTKNKDSLLSGVMLINTTVNTEPVGMKVSDHEMKQLTSKYEGTQKSSSVNSIQSQRILRDIMLEKPSEQDGFEGMIDLKIEQESLLSEIKTSVVPSEKVSPASFKATNQIQQMTPQRQTEPLQMQDRDMILIVNNHISRDTIVSDASYRSEQVNTESLLREALFSTGNAEIVKRAQFILRSEQTGEIRLMLRPEHLGAVRININIEDGRVLGRIIVANASVKEAFNDNLQDLRDSFLKSGYHADFDVEYHGEKKEDSQQPKHGYTSERLRQNQSEETNEQSSRMGYWQEERRE